MLDFRCWMLVRRDRRRVIPRADAWGCGRVGANRWAVNVRSGLANRTQIGFPLFAEALQFVQGAVESALETAFLAVEQSQRAFAPRGCMAHAAGVIQLEIFLHAYQTLQLAVVETGFLMVEA